MKEARNIGTDMASSIDGTKDKLWSITQWIHISIFGLCLVLISLGPTGEVQAATEDRGEGITSISHSYHDVVNQYRKPGSIFREGRVWKYVVRRNDTLSHIAWWFLGDARRYHELGELNGMANPHLIHPGDVIVLGEELSLSKSVSIKWSDIEAVIGEPEQKKVWWDGGRTGYFTKGTSAEDICRKLGVGTAEWPEIAEANHGFFSTDRVKTLHEPIVILSGIERMPFFVPEHMVKKHMEIIKPMAAGRYERGRGEESEVEETILGRSNRSESISKRTSEYPMEGRKHGARETSRHTSRLSSADLPGPLALKPITDAQEIILSNRTVQVRQELQQKVREENRRFLWTVTLAGMIPGLLLVGLGIISSALRGHSLTFR